MKRIIMEKYNHCIGLSSHLARKLLEIDGYRVVEIHKKTKQVLIICNENDEVIEIKEII